MAGLRESLDDARGNLSLVYMKALHAIKPRNAIVENVPGWLSTKDNAFGCFLAGLVGAVDALIPSADLPAVGKSNRYYRWDKKDQRHVATWPNAGMVAGPQGRAAWRVCDAQFWGLAQRRKRVIVVADFGSGADPAAVLFEPEGVRRDSPPSRETGEGVAAAASKGTKGGGGLETDFDLDGGLVARQWPAEIAPTLNAAFGSKQGLEDQHALGGAGLFVPAVHAIQAGALRTNPNSGPDGVGVHADIAYTLEARAEVQAVSVTGPISHALKAEGADASEDGTGRGTPIVTTYAPDVAGTLKACSGKSGTPNGAEEVDRMVVQTVALRGREGGATALRASSGGGDKPHVLTSAVRRLTPRECERLQGFQFRCTPAYPGAWQDDEGRWWSPDYTAITYRKVSARKLDADYTKYLARGNPKNLTREEAAALANDGPRYKALGNSWAVPLFTWLGERIQRFMPPR